jgi:hypothetical protein
MEQTGSEKCCASSAFENTYPEATLVFRKMCSVDLEGGNARGDKMLPPSKNLRHTLTFPRKKVILIQYCILPILGISEKFNQSRSKGAAPQFR